MSKLSEQIENLEFNFKEEQKIVDRIWQILGSPSYESLKGRSIFDLITELRDKTGWYPLI